MSEWFDNMKGSKPEDILQFEERETNGLDFCSANYNAFSSFVTKAKYCNYSEYFTYASKLPKSQRFGKSSIVLAQVLNLLKYMDNADKFKPLKFNLQPVKINGAL